jgi:hypothetical protein
MKTKLLKPGSELKFGQALSVTIQQRRLRCAFQIRALELVQR